MKQDVVLFFIKAIIEYLNLISGNDKSASLVKSNILRKKLHPAVKYFI
jgi:hypothetical protein